MAESSGNESEADPEINSQLFYQHMPIIGRTPHLFYVPETNCGASDRIKALIRKHGGISTEYHECCTIQIKPTISDLQYDSFFPGDIYSEKWLAACVKANKIIKKEEFCVGSVPLGQG